MGKNSQCSEWWVDTARCNSDAYWRAQCPKKCGDCSDGAVQPCEDHNSQCSQSWIDAEKCKESVYWRAQCPKKCGDCPACSSTDNGATGLKGTTCDHQVFVNDPTSCNNYDDDDFSASVMCCACGGGTTSQATPATSTPAPATPAPVMQGCGCDEYRNQATVDDVTFCTKRENSKKLCYPPNHGDGLCPGDMITCANPNQAASPRRMHERSLMLPVAPAPEPTSVLDIIA